MQNKNAYTKKTRKYIKYANSHLSDISKTTHHQFLLRHSILREEYIHRLSQVVSARLPDGQESVPHYELQPSNNPETTPKLVEKGVITDLERTVADFLENEYSGQWQDPRGKDDEGYWRTWGDELNEESLKIVMETVKMGYRDVLTKAFPDDFFPSIYASNSVFDHVIENRLEGFAPWQSFYNTMFWRRYVEYLDLTDWKLKDVIAYNDAHLTGERWT